MKRKIVILLCFLATTSLAQNKTVNIEDKFVTNCYTDRFNIDSLTSFFHEKHKKSLLVFGQNTYEELLFKKNGIGIVMVNQSIQMIIFYPQKINKKIQNNVIIDRFRTIDDIINNSFVFNISWYPTDNQLIVHIDKFGSTFYQLEISNDKIKNLLTKYGNKIKNLNVYELPQKVFEKNILDLLAKQVSNRIILQKEMPPKMQELR